MYGPATPALWRLFPLLCVLPAGGGGPCSASAAT